MPEDQEHTEDDQGGMGEAATYSNLGKDGSESKDTEVKDRHVASVMDRLMTLAANAEKAGNTDIAEKFRATAEGKGTKAGEEFDAKEESTRSELARELELSQAMLELFLGEPDRHDAGLLSGREGVAANEQAREAIYKWLGVTEARAQAERQNVTVTRTNPSGVQRDESGPAYVMESDFGRVVELISRDVRGDEFYNITIERPEGDK